MITKIISSVCLLLLMCTSIPHAESPPWVLQKQANSIQVYVRDNLNALLKVFSGVFTIRALATDENPHLLAYNN